ncbi:long-chain-fatty-acid--CoA ligase [Sporosarcina ureilytica]|uniref:Long-chain fatty acid--CoA ligase n=1 Tax=Sporosarcina ureilytica TaxID=298596 RepID=A0A1D8JF51_9BACL|nr:long-chain fatty acid--CoA ligase [Sporosarcina ureilytica]AOV07340.1 long-chain fatty acid--CoA ligase [Sporosarcina ureilytica]
MDRPWMQHVAEGNPKHIEIPNLSLTQLLDEAIATYPKHTAMTFFKNTYTYTDLDEKIKQTACALTEKGVQKGDRVALMLPNCPQYPISFYGALHCGATIVQVNPMYQVSELIHILNDSGTKVLIILDKLLPLFESIRKQTPVEKVIAVSIESSSMPNELVPQAESALPDVDINPTEDVAVLQYTGGTTGTPKGAMLTHFNIVANTLQSAATSFVRTNFGKERVLTAIPLFHVYGMTSAMCVTFHIGGNLILVPRFDVEQLVSIIEKSKPTSLPGVPTMYIALVNYYKTKKFDLSCLNLCSSGSAPLPLEILNRFNELSGTTVAEGYGLSEASPVTHRNPVRGLQKEGSIGIPIPNTDAKIVDVATGEHTLPYGEVGELIIKGPQIMKGYWNQPEETEHTIRNGWLYTGDLATMDADGFFYIVGRKKEMIIASGYNVYPIEVENVIYTHPAVLEAAVFGVPDEYRGETIRAVVALKKDCTLTEEELLAHCRSNLSAYKIPEDVIFVEELPKTAVGKILKRTLQEQFTTVNSKTK